MSKTATRRTTKTPSTSPRTPKKPAAAEAAPRTARPPSGVDLAELARRLLEAFPPASRPAQPSALHPHSADLDHEHERIVEAVRDAVAGRHRPMPALGGPLRPLTWQEAGRDPKDASERVLLLSDGVRTYEVFADGGFVATLDDEEQDASYAACDLEHEARKMTEAAELAREHFGVGWKRPLDPRSELEWKRERLELALAEVRDQLARGVQLAARGAK